jgi:Arc/MetJ family transcription regulator
MMPRLDIELDEETMATAQEIADRRGIPVESLVSEAVAQRCRAFRRSLAAAGAMSPWGDELDEIVREIYLARAEEAETAASLPVAIPHG